MTEDTSKVFDSPNGSAGEGHNAVWFDRMIPVNPGVQVNFNGH